MKHKMLGKFDCPYCQQAESRVVDARPSVIGGYRRRRECLSCHQRFTTEESVIGRYHQNPPSTSTHHNI